MMCLLYGRVAAWGSRIELGLGLCAWAASLVLCSIGRGQTPLELTPPLASPTALAPPALAPTALAPPALAPSLSQPSPSQPSPSQPTPPQPTILQPPRQPDAQSHAVPPARALMVAPPAKATNLAPPIAATILAPPTRASIISPPPQTAMPTSTQPTANVPPPPPAPIPPAPIPPPRARASVLMPPAGDRAATPLVQPHPRALPTSSMQPEIMSSGSAEPGPLQPTIAAVRTQLEILSPPPAQPVWRATSNLASDPPSMPNDTRQSTQTTTFQPQLAQEQVAQPLTSQPLITQPAITRPLTAQPSMEPSPTRQPTNLQPPAAQGHRYAAGASVPPPPPPPRRAPAAVFSAPLPSLSLAGNETYDSRIEVVTNDPSEALHLAQVPAAAAPMMPSESIYAVPYVQEAPQSILALVEPTWQFNFQNAPWSLVIRSFAKQNGLALQMMAEPQGTFTFVDDRPYPAPEALDLLNDYLLSEGFLLIRNGSKLTTVAAGGPVQEGLVPFVPMRQIDVLGRNELASVAIPIRATDAPQVLGEVQTLLSRLGRAQVVSNSSRLVVTDTGAYLRRARDILGGYGLAASDIQTVVIHLKNTTAESVAATISAHLGSSIGASSVTAAAGTTPGGGVVQAASFSATSTSLSSARVIPDRETNSLLLSGTPAEVAEVQALVCQLDSARAQVVLQGLILEVNLGNTRELGAEVGLQDSVLFNRSVIDNLVTLQQTNTAPNGVQTTSQQVVSQTSAPGFGFNNQALGNNTAISPSVIGAQGLGNLGVGRTNSQLGFGGMVLSASSSSVSLLLRALQANYEVDVLSRPQIRTVDNKEAFIQIGQQVPVVDGVNVTAVGTANPIIRQDQAGIILRMTPNVSPDGLIQIKVSAEKSAFKLQPGTGVPIFTDARNGTVIQAPIKDITTAQATVSARAGQTIVLGGMITRDEETIERRVPGLSRIPLIGRLFRYDYNNATRKELLIFLTPHLITDDLSSDVFKDVEIGRLHAPLDRATEIHGQLLGSPQQPIIEQPIIEQVITPQ